MCPASHHVRQRLTELGITYTIHQMPVRNETRTELQADTGHTTIPLLLADGEVIAGEAAIHSYLNEHFTKPPDAERMLSIVANDELATTATEVRQRLAAVVNRAAQG